MTMITKRHTGADFRLLRARFYDTVVLQLSTFQ